MSSSTKCKQDDSPRLLNRPFLSPKEITGKQKKISVDFELFDYDQTEETTCARTLLQRRSSSTESVASDTSSISTETHLHPICPKPRSWSVESSTSSTESGYYSPVSSPLSTARNRRHSICVTIENAPDVHFVRRQINIENVEDRVRINNRRPFSAVAKGSNLLMKQIPACSEHLKEKTVSHRNVKKFEDWLAEKAVYERQKMEQQHALEVVKTIETAKHFRERLARGKSYDEWLERKTEMEGKNRKISVSRRETDRWNEGKTKDEKRKQEAAKKYDEWLKMKFQQEMKHEQDLIEKQRLRLKKLKNDSKNERK